eukprot:2853511-Alexandrium_andersonii.AAC.1
MPLRAASLLHETAPSSLAHFFGQLRGGGVLLAGSFGRSPKPPDKNARKCARKRPGAPRRSGSATRTTALGQQRLKP